MLGGGADIILFVSQLKGVDADVILTGEMSHHAVRLMRLRTRMNNIELGSV